MRSFQRLLLLILVTACFSKVYGGQFGVKDSVKFYVYTRENPLIPQALQANAESVVRNIINPAKPTTLAIHGMMGDRNAEEYAVIRDSKLLLEDGNVIVVDYSALIQGEDFALAVAVAPHIADACSDLITVLHQYFDMDLQSLHVVGFSLGAQITGLVGQEVSQRCGEKVKRITALDPAGNLFNNTTPLDERLSADDAAYVEVIHTNTQHYGFLSPCGHVDYYPNGGKIQPGCHSSDARCSHVRAYELIPDMWLPRENHELLLLKCSGIEYLSGDVCRWQSVRMGDLQHENDQGVYYVETNAAWPFGKGAFKAQFM